MAVHRERQMLIHPTDEMARMTGEIFSRVFEATTGRGLVIQLHVTGVTGTPEQVEAFFEEFGLRIFGNPPIVTSRDPHRPGRN